MALTSVQWANGTPIPSVAGQVSVASAAAAGFAITYMAGQANVAPAKYVQITGAADWYFSHADNQAITGAMQKVLANQVLTVQVPCNIYALAATGTVVLTALWAA